MLRHILLASCLLLVGCGVQPSSPLSSQADGANAEANGIFNKPVSVLKAVADIFSGYDHNRNGQIDMARSGGFWPPFLGRDELTRKETVRSEERDRQGRVKVIYTTYTYSRAELFYAADADHDGVVRRDDLLGVVAKFDRDGDGMLTRRGFWGWITRKDKGEYDLFVNQFGEKQIDYRRDEFEKWDIEGQERLEGGSVMVDAPTPLEELKPTSASTGR